MQHINVHQVTMKTKWLQIFNCNGWNMSWLGNCHNWRALCKPAPSDYFVAIFQVAPNRLKFGMSTLFVLKNVPVFFFPQAGKQVFKHILESSPPAFSHPPPPPPSIPSNSIKDTCSVLALKDRNSTLFWDEQRGRGGGVEFDTILSILHFCILEKKNTKTVDMPNFSRFGATWKISTK